MQPITARNSETRGRGEGGGGKPFPPCRTHHTRFHSHVVYHGKNSRPYGKQLGRCVQFVCGLGVISLEGGVGGEGGHPPGEGRVVIYFQQSVSPDRVETGKHGDFFSLFLSFRIMEIVPPSGEPPHPPPPGWVGGGGGWGGSPEGGTIFIILKLKNREKKITR